MASNRTASARFRDDVLCELHEFGLPARSLRQAAVQGASLPGSLATIDGLSFLLLARSESGRLDLATGLHDAAQLAAALGVERSAVVFPRRSHGVERSYAVTDLRSLASVMTRREGAT